MLLVSAFMSLSLMSYSQTKAIYVIPSTAMVVETTFDNAQLKYPILTIDGALYFPLSWELTRALGFVSNYHPSTGLTLSQNKASTLPLTSRSYGKSLIGNSVAPVTYPIKVDGQLLVSNKPFYNIAGVTYVALNETPALRKIIQFTSKDGLFVMNDKPLTTLPKAFNTYTLLDAKKFIRNQGSAATCWAFAANTLFEIKIAKETGVINDFSEDHMITNAPIPSTYESGGHFLASSVYYQNGLGPVNESLAPIESQSKGKLFDVAYTVLSYLEINNNLTATKNAIYEHGAVITSLYLNEDDKNVYNSETASYFNSKTANPRTHELVLVGWDDAYSKENFKVKPKSDGAFIAQNSFGNSWGKDGFFYVSYEDAHILNQAYTISGFENKAPNSSQYYYDKTGMTHFESFDASHSAVGLNHYIALNDEKLKRISFYTAEANTGVDLYYGLGTFSKGSLNTSKYTMLLADKGFHTIDLPESLAIKAKNGFWVAAKFSGQSPFVVAIEAPYPGIYYPLSANVGEGYIGNGTIFKDMTTIRDKASIALRATTYK